MDVGQLKEDVLAGVIRVDRLIDVVVTSQRELQAAKQELEQARQELEQARQELEQAWQELEQAKQRIAELERQQGGSPTEKVSEPFSVRAEEQRQAARGKKRRKRKRGKKSGLKRTAEKVAQAGRTEKVFPAGVPVADCWLSHTRPVWRLENGQAVLVAYEIYRGPNSQYGKIPGVLGRSEFGMEIFLAIAYQVYIVGLSFDKVCLLMNFFQNLKLRKSQADALLKRLARHWEGEFDVLCLLLANSLVVQADETGWSINSVWALLSEKARLVLFGVHKDAATLWQLLDPATFAGTVISDDAAVYAKFTHAQKCWAHLLRKAIKLTLLEPTNVEYRRLVDRLLEIYHEACRVQRDQRFGAEGRAEKVLSLEDEVFDLCAPTWAAELPPGEGPADDYRLLCEEVMRLLLADQLFTFVTAAPVEKPNGESMAVPGTNNEAERTLRSPAQARDTGRTNKTVPGARRQTVIVSVLESLRQYLPTYTLSSVIEEVQHWFETGRSCFVRLAKKLGLTVAGCTADGRSSLLDRVLPMPGG
jgi:transposase